MELLLRKSSGVHMIRNGSEIPLDDPGVHDSIDFTLKSLTLQQMLQTGNQNADAIPAAMRTMAVMASGFTTV